MSLGEGRDEHTLLINSCRFLNTGEGDQIPNLRTDYLELFQSGHRLKVKINRSILDFCPLVDIKENRTAGILLANRCGQ